MKICTVTCHNSVNHGARLQACALLHYLHECGYEATVVDYRPDYMSVREKIWYWPNLRIKEWAKFFLGIGQRMDAVRRYENFEKFSARYILRTKRVYRTVEELRREPPRADVYIAGSDQIWNTSFQNGTDRAYYLDFGPQEVVRISYAASFALPSLEAGREAFVKKYLSAFDHISVREESGLKILESLDYKGRVVADPVFLLSSEKWDKLLGCIDTIEPYILVYDFMGCNTIKRIAKRLAKLNGCKIYSASYRRLRYADRNFTQIGPDKFVELVRNARCVISNSFHGTAFAMIYHRDFFVVERSDGLNERMYNLLVGVGLYSRLVADDVTDDKLKSHIDYEDAERTMQHLVDLSKRFLSEALSVK